MWWKCVLIDVPDFRKSVQQLRPSGITKTLRAQDPQEQDGGVGEERA